MRRTLPLAFVLILGLIATLLLATPPWPHRAKAVDQVEVTVTNADIGLYWRSAPDWSSGVEESGQGVYNGDVVALTCLETKTGGTVPPYYNNHTWYRAHVVSGRGQGSGVINDHFLVTGSDAPDQPVAGLPGCDGSEEGNTGTSGASSSSTQSVFYSGTDQPSGSSATAVAETNVALSKWESSGGNCLPSNAIDQTPAGASVLAAWSRGRAAIGYLLAYGRSDQIENVHRIVLFDPGKDSEMAAACDGRYDMKQLLASWLKANSANQLVILSGERTEDKAAGHFGPAYFTGIRTRYLASVHGTPQAGQVLFCDYNNLAHEAVLSTFGYIVQSGASSCPTDSAVPSPVRETP
jgi:hypothetical protein